MVGISRAYFGVLTLIRNVKNGSNMVARKGEAPLPKVNPRTGRTRLIAANWKMNLNHLEAIQVVQKLHFKLRTSDYEYCEISIHPPFVDIRSLQLLIDSDRMNFSLGAQNCYFEAKGAFTGEVSTQMLSKLGVRNVIVGHSERRSIFQEDDGLIAKKVKAVFDSQMIPILCVGETADERSGGLSADVLSRQVSTAIKAVTPEVLSNLVIAYEPVWAIGSGTPASVKDASDGADLIRGTIESIKSKEVAQAVRILYGGSVTSANSRDFLESPSLDGLLVGGASLDPDDFAALIEA